jgi:HEAT repeat protein
MSLLGLDKFPNSRIAAVLDAPRHTALKSIIERKDDTSKIVRFWVASLLGHYKDEASFRSLETMLKDEDPNVRAAACESLGNIGDKRAIGLVHNMLGDEYWFVRLHAIKALGEFLDTESIDKIIPSLRDKNWWVRYNAKSALKKIGLNVAPHIYPVLDDEDRFARNSAAEILEDIGAMDILLKDILERHVSEEKIRKDLVNFVKSEGFLWLRSRLEKLNSEDRRKILGIIEKEDKKIYAEIIKNMLVTAGER